jgi:hypothetical protein
MSEKTEEAIVEERIARDSEAIKKYYGEDTQEARAMIALVSWRHKNENIVRALQEEEKLQGDREAYGLIPQRIVLNKAQNSAWDSLQAHLQQAKQIDGLKVVTEEHLKRIGQRFIGLGKPDYQKLLETNQFIETQLKIVRTSA